jgi:hypothetical protein
MPSISDVTGLFWQFETRKSPYLVHDNYGQAHLDVTNGVTGLDVQSEILTTICIPPRGRNTKCKLGFWMLQSDWLSSEGKTLLISGGCPPCPKPWPEKTCANWFASSKQETLPRDAMPSIARTQPLTASIP